MNMLAQLVPRFMPISFQVLKNTTTWQAAKCFRTPVIHNGPSTRILDGYGRKLYSQQAAPEAMTVTYEEVMQATSDNNVLIIDVREPDEIKEYGRIPNSINIPLGNITPVLSTMSDKEFQKSYNRVKPTEDTEIIVYCMVGKRSGKAQQNAISLGFKNVKNYLGSWTDWASKKQ